MLETRKQETDFLVWSQEATSKITNLMANINSHTLLLGMTRKEMNVPGRETDW